MNLETKTLDFQQLVGTIHKIHDELTAQASRAVNISLTLRNWLIGLYIREYEQHGRDRAHYGEALLDALASALRHIGMARSDARELRRYRLFYITYPQIRDALPPEFSSRLLQGKDLGVSDSQMPPASQLDGGMLVARLSFTHLAELLAIEDSTKRSFYEVECIRGNWSVRELKRQIGSLYYERSGLSRRHMMTDGDNPPIGILLCAERNHALAEYALAGMDNQLFVSKYLLELPGKEAMQSFIEGQVKEIGGQQ